MDRVREVMRLKHYSIRIEQSDPAIKAAIAVSTRGRDRVDFVSAQGEQDPAQFDKISDEVSDKDFESTFATSSR